MPSPCTRLAIITALVLAISWPAAAAQPRSSTLDLTGDAWSEIRLQAEAEAMAYASMLEDAHVRTLDWLEGQVDDSLAQALVDALVASTSGELPLATAAHAVFGSAERTRYHDAGIRQRVCGPWLVTMLEGDAQGRVGTETAGWVRSQAQLALVTSAGLEPWNADLVSDADITACALPTGAAAMFGRWRAPALERMTHLAAETRVLDCPAGEVGPGIFERREVETKTDGFEAAQTGETVTGAWTEEWRDCRTPRSGEVRMALECTIASGHRAGEQGTRVVAYGWTEQRDPNDSRKVVKMVDWTTATVVLDLCRDGTASEEVDVTTVHDLVTRPFTCLAYHSSAEWDLGGPVIEERDRYTSDIVFPPSWNRPDERVVALDPWRVQKDDCRKHVDMSLEGETRTGDCPAGYYGPGIYQNWTDYWTQVIYAAPVPFVADHKLAGTYRRVPGGSVARCASPSSNGGGDSDRGDNTWRDSVTGIVYDRQPPGATHRDGNTGDYGDGRNTSRWENDRREELDGCDDGMC